MKDIETLEDITFLVNQFYEKATIDPTISHFFTDVIQLNFEKHIPVISSFWESILFKKATYSGNPMLKHLELNALSPLTKAHFDRWLFLWKQTIDEHFTGELANEAISRAQQIGQLMQFKIAKHS